MANIRDVAKLSGHSVSTVSRALNHSGYVSAATRQEILVAVKQLDYHRNDIALALSTGKTHQIGVIIPFVNRPYFQKLTAAITAEAFEQGYQVTLLPTNYQPERERQYLAMLKHHLLDGLIFLSRSLPFSELVDFRDYGPIVCCEDTFDYPLASVFTNRGESFVHAFQLLKQCGFRHIGVTVSRDEHHSQSAKLTLQAYKMVYGPQLDPVLIYRHTCRMTDGIAAAQQFMAADDQLEIIFANDDEIAAGAQRELQQQGHGALVIGQENIPVSFLMDYSTIDHRLTEMGTTAFKLLFQPEIMKQAISSELILRGRLKKIVAQQQAKSRS
ncbi:LacI family transcriptional regulator [Lactiplantibacillus fabifermentans T30PCM01]|uniref:LacI family transcriptional regulator n=1 Tax=Lactiplantibacillus fabifermentans T30PCM01 TaxID=1400520 RepID=W6TBT7_9LACO|nr:LacI family DNA-binding transcriptional regulator [Lactiplantibacillus fabifermentans]ETY73210.1 LacI family transcriptional regulator [Lactiplantibacillus fabifermentans T30PCM01]